MIVTSDQFERMQQDQDRRFLIECAEQMRSLWPREAEELPPEVFDERVRKAVEAARAHGIVGGQPTCRFVNLQFGVFSIFPDITQVPWLLPILEDASLGPDPKVDRLWEEVHRQTGPALR